MVINIGHLLSCNFLSSLVALVGVAIAARALGPAAYGIMTLIVSYTRLIERILRFESWQPLIKYAADLNKAAVRAAPRRLYAFGLALSVSATLTAALTSALLSVASGSHSALQSDTTGPILTYSFSMGSNILVLTTALLLIA